MLVEDIVNLIDYPDDVTITIYSYGIHDIIFTGLSEEISPNILVRKIRGLEFTGTNCLMINVEG